MTNNKEIIGYKLKEKIEGFKTNIGDICKDSKYFPLYKDHPKFEPVYKEEPIPEYVECVKELTGAVVGKIYKTDSNGYVTCGMRLYGVTTSRNNPDHQFKPSTKEAYDLQNNSKFEVGKWYKNYHKAPHYMKCINFDTNYLYGNEYINLKHQVKQSGNCNWSWSSVGPELLTDLSEIQPFLPDGHPDKIVKEFVLPEKWYIECNEENQDIVSNWRGDFRDFKIPIGGVAGMYDWGTRISKEHNIDATPRENWGTEITFEQFKKYVLKEIDWSKATKEELLAEAKRRYPGGVLVKSALSQYPDHKKYVFTDQIRYISNLGNIITNHITLYSKFQNKWAEIVEKPKPVEPTKELFSKEQLDAINLMIDKKIKELE